MARVKFGSIISEASGSIGSATFQRSLYGNILRNRPRNTRTGTPLQLYSRSLMVTCQNAWRALTVPEQKQWNQFIAFSGAHIKRDSGVLLTGHSLFLKYNFFRLMAGLGILSSITYVSMPVIPTVSYLKYAPSTLSFILSDNVTHTALWFILKMSWIRPSTLAYSAAGILYINITPSTNNSWNIYNSYVALFGDYANVGETVHYSIQFFSVTAPLISSPSVGKIEVIAL